MKSSGLERWLGRLRWLPVFALVLVLGWFGVVRIPVTAAEAPPPPADAHAVNASLHEIRMARAELERLSDRLDSYLEVYLVRVAPVERTLIRRGVSAETARRVSWPLVQHAQDRGLDPAKVLAVMLVESNGQPWVTSPVGARGLMQVMPLWAGVWRDCGQDLYAIDDNLCNGTRILAYYLHRHRDPHSALLAYNGCVHGTNTPDCFDYPDKVERLRRQIQHDWDRSRLAIAEYRGAPAGAASP